MKTKIKSLVLVAVAWSFGAGVARAQLYVQKVECNGTLLGEMQIDTYQAGIALINGLDRGNVIIDGKFVSAGPLLHNLQYVQVVTLDDSPPRYKDGSALTAPYVDPPPGGYQADPFDYKPYYDATVFPQFGDQPTARLALAFDNKTFHLRFETWLVCVVSENLGPNPLVAADDLYTLAPLLGWTWGFDLTDNNPAAQATLIPADFTATATPFMWDTDEMPSDTFLQGLNATYGAASDHFEINLVDCSACAVPEPSSYAMLGAGLMVVVAAIRFRRHHGRPGTTGSSTF